MEVQEIMTAKVITVGQDEPVTAAARLLRRWNLGALPVTDSTGRLRGVLTDRDIVLRCLALDNDPADTRVSEVMSRAVVTGTAGRQRAERRRAHGARAAAPSARGGKRAARRHGDGVRSRPARKARRRICRSHARHQRQSGAEIRQKPLFRVGRARIPDHRGAIAHRMLRSPRTTLAPAEEEALPARPEEMDHTNPCV